MKKNQNVEHIFFQPLQVWCKWKIWSQTNVDVGSHGSLTHSPFTLGSFIFNQKYYNNKVRNTSLHVSPNRYSRTSCRFECALKKALATSHCLPWYLWSSTKQRQKIFNEECHYQRYLPNHPENHTKTCRFYLHCHLMPYTTLFYSSNETHWFLKKMNSVSESDCDCLPDCEHTEFQHSHSITNLM